MVGLEFDLWCFFVHSIFGIMTYHLLVISVMVYFSKTNQPMNFAIGSELRNIGFLPTIKSNKSNDRQSLERINWCVLSPNYRTSVCRVTVNAFELVIIRFHTTTKHSCYSKHSYFCSKTWQFQTVSSLSCQSSISIGVPASKAVVSIPKNL